MAPKFLDGANIVAGFKEMGGEGVAEGVAIGGSGNGAGLDRYAQDSGVPPLLVGNVQDATR